MLLIKKEIVLEWLKSIDKNQTWLGKILGGYGKSYISQLLNNKCKISTGVIEKILTITHMSFERIFYFDGKPDNRMIGWNKFFVADDIYDTKEYQSFIKKTIKSRENRRKVKKHLDTRMIECYIARKIYERSI